MDEKIKKMLIQDDFHKPPDYLSFVDSDIAAIFADKGGYFLNDILMAQIIKELRKLNDG